MKSVIYVLIALALFAVAAAPVSAITNIPDTHAIVTYNTFTISAETMDKYALVSYGILEKGARLRTPLIATPKTGTTFTVTVPDEWAGKLIYYQICTWHDQYGNGGDCGNTNRQFAVQLAQKEIKKPALRNIPGKHFHFKNHRR